MSNVIDPLALLTANAERQPSFLNKAWNPTACAVAGFGMAMFLNWGFRKPPLSGIQNHVLLTIAGGGLGVWLDGKRDVHLAKRDAVLRHYVQLHPDDFPPIERKKYADVLEAWAPIR